VEFGEWLYQNVIKAVPHRHFVFSIPKILRRYFLYDRSLLLELSRCIWETLKIYYQQGVPGKNSVPGAVIALQTFGDFLGFNPHGHVLITDGCFPEKGLFVVAPTVKLKYLEKIFRSKVLTLLKPKTLEFQLDYSDSQLTFYEDASDPDFEILVSNTRVYLATGFSVQYPKSPLLNPDKPNWLYAFTQ
jgi:hypothetical protein